jgi:hypothetical protein
MERLDGNAIGGILGELLGGEMTAAMGTCSSCGARGIVAELHVYVRAPGVVARCPQCESVLIRVVRSPDRAWLDLSGLAVLELYA